MFLRVILVYLTLLPCTGRALQWSEKDILTVVNKVQGEVSFLYLTTTDRTVSELHICERIGGLLELAQWLPLSTDDLNIRREGFTPDKSERLISLMSELRKMINGLEGRFCNANAPDYKNRKALARETFVMMSEVRAIKVTLFGAFGFEPLYIHE